MEFLDMESDQPNIIRMPGSTWAKKKICDQEKRPKNQSRPVTGGIGFVG